MTNKFPAACAGCGTPVPAGAGSYDYGKVHCMTCVKRHAITAAIGKRPMIAKYPGRCLLCRQPVAAGTSVYFFPGEGVRHVECPPPEPSHMTNTQVAELAYARFAEKKARAV